jgi:hypothetical protein
MFATHCDSVEEVAKALATLRAMVMNAEMDEQLATASKDIRARFIQS